MTMDRDIHPTRLPDIASEFLAAFQELCRGHGYYDLVVMSKWLAPAPIALIDPADEYDTVVDDLRICVRLQDQCQSSAVRVIANRTEPREPGENDV